MKSFYLPSHRIPSKPYLTTPFKDPFSDDITEIIVTDPRQPLFGRHFQVLSIQGQRFSSGYAYVPHRQGLNLRIPLSATNISSSSITSSPKLSYSAVKDLISLSEECNALCPTALKPSTQDCPLRASLRLKKTSP